MDIDREEETYRVFVRESLAAILAEVKTTNGRVRKAELNIAILQWGYGLAAIMGAALVGAFVMAIASGLLRVAA